MLKSEILLRILQIISLVSAIYVAYRAKKEYIYRTNGYNIVPLIIGVIIAGLSITQCESKIDANMLAIAAPWLVMIGCAQWTMLSISLKDLDNIEYEDEKVYYLYIPVLIVGLMYPFLLEKTYWIPIAYIACVAAGYFICTLPIIRKLLYDKPHRYLMLILPYFFIRTDYHGRVIGPINIGLETLISTCLLIAIMVFVIRGLQRLYIHFFGRDKYAVSIMFPHGTVLVWAVMISFMTV